MPRGRAQPPSPPLLETTMKKLLVFAFLLPAAVFANDQVRTYHVELKYLAGVIDVEQELASIADSVENITDEGRATLRRNLETANKGQVQKGTLLVRLGGDYAYMEGPVLARGVEEPVLAKELLLKDCTLSSLPQNQKVYAGITGNLFPTAPERWILLGVKAEGAEIKAVPGQPDQHQLITPGITDTYLLIGSDPSRPDRVEAFFTTSEGVKRQLFEMKMQWRDDVPVDIEILRYRDDKPSTTAKLSLASAKEETEGEDWSSFFASEDEVMDMRLSNNKPESMRNLSYHWDGKLPTRAELLKMEEGLFADMKPEPSAPPRNPLVFVGVAALFAIAGGVLVWRRRTAAADR